MKILSVFKVTLKSWLRSRSGVFFSFLFPMLLLLVFGTVFGGGGSTRFNLFIQNLDVSNGNATQLSTVFIDALNSTNVLQIITVPSDVDARAFAQDYSGQFSNYRILVIPGGFQNKTLNNAANLKLNITYSTLNYTLLQFINFIPQNQTESIRMGMIMFKDFLSNSTVTYENLTYIYDPSDPAAMTVEGIINSVVSAFNYRLIGAAELIRFQYQTFVTRKLNAVDYYMPGYIAAFIMTNGIIGLNSIMSDLRRRGVVKRLLSTPLTKLEWILGNILTQIFIGLLLTLVMVIFGYLVFGIVAIPDALSIIIILVGVVAFSGLGMIFGSPQKR